MAIRAPPSPRLIPQRGRGGDGESCRNRTLAPATTSVKRVYSFCLWSETLSPANWSVILSPHEGDDHVEPKGTDEGKGTDDGAGKEVHERRGSGATTRIESSLTEA